MYSTTPIYDGVEVEVEGVRQKVIVFGLMVEAVNPDSSDELYTVPQGGEGRLDLISQQKYGTSELWWVIAGVNYVLDPLVGFVAGQIIRVPKKERLASEGILSV